MSRTDKHPPGGFCWIELGTTDQPAAKSFYSSLFGWSTADSPMGPNDDYTLFALGGRTAASCYTLRQEEQRVGIPAHWNLYIAAESAEAATRRAAACEGRVFCGPLDVSTHGRMSTIADPTGAVFSVWEPKDQPGIGVAEEDGSFCWAELSTPDPARAAKFYQDVFGWSMRGGAIGYLHIGNQGKEVGGIPPVSHRQPHEPPHWRIYFQVADCDASTKQAAGLGGNLLAGPMTIEGVGRISLLADPQGAIFSLFQPFPHS